MCDQYGWMQHSHPNPPSSRRAATREGPCKPTRHPTDPNPGTHSQPRGPWRRPHDVPPTLNHHLHPKTNSRSVLQGYPLRFWAPLRSARLPWFFRHNPKACVPNIDPPPPCPGSGRGPASETHSFSQSALPQFPSRVVVCTRLCGTVLISLPPLPGPSHHPPYTPKPHTCDQIPFCSRAPMGAQSCCLVLPRPSLLCRRLNFYVPGEPAPTRGWGALRMYSFKRMRGRYPGRRHYP